ncbi:MAG: metalloregulator ArsR/SmtB family transcription factor [Bacteroidota bacterium]|nr:metalloregulator ArsR/SmtB family transcription factor [Bacteroidota bacterium]
MRLKHFSLNYGTQIFKSFSEESRVRILNQIFLNKEMCISDLELVLGYSQTKTSRHLIYLKNSGLLNCRNVDQWVFYFLKDEVIDIISQIFKLLYKDPTLINDSETYRILYSNRELAINKLHLRKWIG